ncbi:MAG: sodium/solute symporter [Rhodopirellula sp.]|nr:sodium/solute symporter [Rhodopirellula sp.]
MVSIGGIDTAILLAYLLGVVALGLWLGRGQRDLADYLLGDRNLPWWAVLLSIVATETSTVTFLSVPGLAFNPEGGNFTFLQLAIGLIVGRFAVIFLLLPQYFRGDLFTAYEVLHRRFGGSTRQAASLLFLVTRNLADGLRLYLTAIVLQKLMGIDLAAAILVMGMATVLYTVFGGMRSVVWNDCIQFVIYILGAILAAWVILDRLPGGWTQLADFAQQHEKFRLLDFGFDFARPYTFWSGLLGGVFLALATHGADQMMVQRYLSAGSCQRAALALGISGFVVAAQFALFLFVGVALACFYQNYLALPTLPKNDAAFAGFIVEYLPIGITGIVLAAVLAAAMSTLASSLNSSAAAAVNDFYVGWRKTEPSKRHLLWAGRILTVVFGLIQITVAIAGRHLAASVVDSVLAIASFTTGAVLGVFFLGILTRGVPQWAALVGLLGGLGVLTFVAFGTPIAWPWYALIGSASTFVLGWTASLLFPSSSKE